VWRAVRQRLQELLSYDAPALRDNEEAMRACLVRRSEVQMRLPVKPRNYTDFYASKEHATNVGSMFRPDNPLLPNWVYIPIGYHGRASSIVVTGTPIRRPNGQRKAPDEVAPTFGPSRQLDFELEMAMIVGKGTAIGNTVPLAEAENHMFGLALFNDWSARDLQAWEYQPLGPFLSKNFASTLSPWMVTMDALAPFRTALQRPPGHPDPLPYLESESNWRAGAMDIDLNVLLQTQAMRDAGMAPEVISRSNAADASFWTPAQLVTHHTVNGCALSAGDLFGSGTLSGPLRDEAGSLLEMTGGGKEPITLRNGETRTFLQDGDRITLRGRCARDGFRSIGFGDCSATVLPAL
jgi:fumarylacetoacetase